MEFELPQLLCGSEQPGTIVTLVTEPVCWCYQRSRRGRMSCWPPRTCPFTCELVDWRLLRFRYVDTGHNRISMLPEGLSSWARVVVETSNDQPRESPWIQWQKLPGRSTGRPADHATELALCHQQEFEIDLSAAIATVAADLCHGFDLPYDAPVCILEIEVFVRHEHGVPDDGCAWTPRTADVQPDTEGWEAAWARMRQIRMGGAEQAGARTTFKCDDCTVYVPRSAVMEPPVNPMFAHSDNWTAPVYTDIGELSYLLPLLWHIVTGRCIVPVEHINEVAALARHFCDEQLHSVMVQVADRRQ